MIIKDKEKCCYINSNLIASISYSTLFQESKNKYNIFLYIEITTKSYFEFCLYKDLDPIDLNLIRSKLYKVIELLVEHKDNESIFDLDHIVKENNK